MAEKIYYRYLVVHASGEMRVTVRQPSLRQYEVAFKIRLRVPDSPWGHVVATPIDVAMPVVAAPEVSIDPLAVGAMRRSKKSA